MKHNEALGILELGKGVSFEDIKAGYRRASSKYHPDRNPAGLEMMKLVNAAWKSLQDYVASEHVEDEESELNLGDEMNAALNAIIHLGLTIEVCGTWIWVSGDTKPHKETLKESGYRWAPKKLMWMWKPEGSKSFGRGKFTMNEIRLSHGSVNVKPKQYQRLSA